MLCYILGAIVENTLSKDGDGANIFCAFNPIFIFGKQIVINQLRSVGQYASYYIIT
jgi:hypothetical protein